MRIKSGKTQKQIAEEIGVSVRTILNIEHLENCNTAIRTDNLSRYVKALMGSGERVLISHEDDLSFIAQFKMPVGNLKTR